MSTLILDQTRIAAIRAHHHFSPPMLSNLTQKLLMVIEEVTEAHRHLRDGHDLTQVTFSADLGFWCKAHHRSDCADLSCSNVRVDESGAWERFELSKPEGFPIEVADALMRLADIGFALGIDLQGALNLKMDYNAQRPTGHGRKY